MTIGYTKRKTEWATGSSQTSSSSSSHNL